MAQMKAMAQRSNPFRGDISWQLLVIEAAAAIGIGVYSLLDESSALRNVVFLIGVYLLVDGLSSAAEEIASPHRSDTQGKFRLIRGGIGIATGTIVVLDRIFDFMNLNPTRVVVGIGLLGIGLVTVWGAVAAREETQLRFGGIGIALLLAAWGVVVLYQAADDSSAMTLFGWAAIVVGVGLAGLAFLRRQRAESLKARPAASVS